MYVGHGELAGIMRAVAVSAKCFLAVEDTSRGRRAEVTSKRMKRLVGTTSVHHINFIRAVGADRCSEESRNVFPLGWLVTNETTHSCQFLRGEAWNQTILADFCQ